MARTRLQRLAILHQRLDGVGIVRPGKTFVLRLHAADDGHGHEFLRKSGVDFLHLQRFLLRLFRRRVSGVAFLPEKFRRAQEQPRPHLPTYYVGPLIDQ